MPELFISYSRRDKAGFVEGFIKALNEKGYSPEQIWVDWEDIPASVDWEAEIHKGIEEADSVIFVLSPNWAASNECAKELTYALKFNKRLFPIIHQAVDPKTLPPELASLNWIYFRETDDFNAALNKLLDALKTDVVWVKIHTHLVTRAKEWDDKKRDNARLLRGNELKEAEDWLAQASDDKQPRPTALQKEYILASRAAAQRAQRSQMIFVTSALVVSIILAFAAVYFAVLAQRQSQNALAFQLAAQSTNLGATQPDLALLLSLKASYIGDELGGAESAWLLGGLVTSLNSSPHLKTYLRDNKNAIRAVAFSPDNQWLAAAGQIDKKGDAVQVTIWKITGDNAETASTLPGPTQRILALTFSADGRHLYGAGDDKKIFVWDMQALTAAPIQWDVQSKVRALAFIELDGHTYVAIGAGQAVTFWDAQTGQKNDDLTVQLQTADKTVRVLSLAFSPVTNLLATGSEEGNVTVWDLTTHALKYGPLCSVEDASIDQTTLCKESGQGRTDIRGLSFSPNGQWLAAGSSDQTAWLWDMNTGQRLARTPDRILGGHLNTVSSVAFDPADKSGRTLATASWDNTVRLWNITGSDTATKFELSGKLIGHSSSVWTLAYSSDGKWLASGSSDHATILWQPSQVSQIGTVVDQLSRDVWALTVSPRQDQLAAGDDAGNIHVWDFDGHALSNLKTLKQSGAVLSLAYSPDDQWLAAVGDDLSIHVYDARTLTEAWSIPNAHTDEIWSVAFSPNGKWMATASYDKTVKIWDVATQTLIGAPITFDDQVYALAFSPNETQLLVAGYATDIRRIDLTQAAPTLLADEPLSGHNAAVNSLAFDPLYPTLLASTSDDKTLLMWDTEADPTVEANHTDPVLGLNESMEAVAFRPDGHWLASATDNKTVLLWQLDPNCGTQWDTRVCQPTNIGSPLIGHKTPVENVVFLSNSVLVSSSADGQLILWNLDKAAWYNRACAIVNRPLSEVELAQYAKGEADAMLKIFAFFSRQRATLTMPVCLENIQP